MRISLYQALPADVRDHDSSASIALLAIISHTIEDVLLTHALPVDLYLGCGRMSHVVRQQGRYEQLAARCRQVVVCAVQDVPPPPIPQVVFVSLQPDEPLTRERFLVIDSPLFCTALLAEEAAGSSGGERRFNPVWTYEAEHVAQSSQLLAQRADQIYQPVVARDYAAQQRYLTQIERRLVQHSAHPSYRQAFLHHRRALLRMLEALEPVRSRTRIDAAMLVRELMTECLPQAQQRAVRLCLDACGDTKLYGDEGWLRLALRELLANALAHAPVESDVEIDLSRHKGYLALHVTDHGDGSHCQAHAPHAATQSVRSAPAPCGLGLALVRAVTQAHAGFMSVDSRPDEYTCCTLLLPVARSASR